MSQNQRIGYGCWERPQDICSKTLRGIVIVTENLTEDTVVGVSWQKKESVNLKIDRDYATQRTERRKKEKNGQSQSNVGQH